MAGNQNHTGVHVPKIRIQYNVDAIYRVVYGRKKDVADLHRDIENIKDRNMFVISGIAGIGKTTVVREYIRQYHKNYSHIIWINAQNVAAAQSQFRLLAAKKLNIQPETGQNNPDDFSDLRERIYEKLCSNQAKVLLVLDNAEAISVVDFDNTHSVESLKSLLPVSLPGPSILTILITSRESAWDQDFFHTIKVGPWTDEECIDFVLKKLKLAATAENKETALGLATYFDRLTISMQSAVAIIWEEKDRQQHEGEVSYGIQDLINDYDRGRKGCLPEIELWNISFERILKRQSGELAIKIICFMSYLSPDAIPKHFLRALLEETNNRECLTDAFVLLTRYSLIDLYGKHYTIHRRIQEAVIQNLKLKRSSNECKIFTDKTFPNEVEVLRQLCKQINTYLSQMTEKEKLDDKNFDVIANCLHVTSHYYNELYSFSECRKFTEAIADIMNNFSNYNKAFELYKAVLESIDPANDNDSKQALEIQDKIGAVLDSQGKIEDALQIYSGMLKVKLQVFGTKHPSTLETQTNYIINLKELKRHDEASKMLSKVQTDIKEMTHLEHPSASIAKFNFAVLIYMHLEDCSAALEMFQNDLKERSESSKPDQRRILNAQNWIALTLLALGRHDEAAELHSKILKKSIEEFGPTSRDTLLYGKKYALALQKQKNPKEALEVWNDVLKYEDSLKESKHVNLKKSVTKHNMANSHIELKEFDKAIDILESLVDFYSKELGPDHPLRLEVMHDLAFAFGANGKHEDSIKIYEQVLQDRIKTFGLCHSDVLITKHNIGVAYFHKGDFKNAHKFASDVLSTRENIVAGDANFDTSVTEKLCRAALDNLAPTT